MHSYHLTSLIAISTKTAPIPRLLNYPLVLFPINYHCLVKKNSRLILALGLQVKLTKQ